MENGKQRLTADEQQRLNKTLGELSRRGLTTTKDGVIVPIERRVPEIVSAAELQKIDIPPIEWLVNNILPTGLAMIGAPSKYFKSYMMLGLCVAICTGGKFLGFDCTEHACLYLDLESTKRRPQNRLKQIMGRGPWPDNLYILTNETGVGRIGDGFEASVTALLEQHPDIKLMVVDVFQMIRQPAKRNQTGYDRDYEDFSVLKQIADRYSIGLMLVHHTRKMKDPNDVFNELSGSVGVMGALDCAWVITKEDRDSTEAVLHITGRDMESVNLKICFNKGTFQWELIGEEETVNKQRELFSYGRNQVANTIKALVKQGGGHWEGSASDLIDASKYLSGGKNRICWDAAKVGKEINRIKAFLLDDGSGFEYDTKDKKKRKYIFTVSPVAPVSPVESVSPVDYVQSKLNFAGGCDSCDSATDGFTPTLNSPFDDRKGGMK